MIRHCSRFPSAAAILGLSILAALAAQPALAGPCASGTSTAAFVGDPLGDYKYCATITWDTGAQGLSHLDVLLELELCPCICDLFSFGAEDTAGYSTGTTNGDTCSVYFQANFMCDGDPTVPGSGPLVKFEYLENGCEPGQSGSGTFCFYSDWPPTAIANPTDNIAVKYGTNVCRGDLTGVLPECTCGSTGTEHGTWGGIKALYR